MLALLAPCATAILVTGTATLPTTTPSAAYTSIASPSQWRSIFLFSNGGGRRTAGKPIGDFVLEAGDTAGETAGAPPILPVRLSWDCREADLESGVLKLASTGVPGVVTSVERRMLVESDGNGGCRVALETEFERGDSPLALLIEPLLRLDHALSTSVLLPGHLGPSGDSKKFQVVWAFLGGVYVLQNMVWMTAYGILKF